MKRIMGVYGAYLDVDLSTGTIGTYEIPADWYVRHLGGRGIATRIFLEELSGGENPLGPENLLVFATGPFQGTGVAGAGRHVVVSRSPKTGTIHDSYVGGFLGHELGRSGYDGLIVRGAAETPKALVIAESTVQLVEAGELWGQDVGTTTDALLARWTGARVCCIGPAGESLIPFACIMQDRTRAAGRAGLGAVMGSKKLKAIVVKGEKEKPIAEPERFSELSRRYARELIEDPSMGKFGELGTPGVLIPLDEMGVLPTRNFRDGEFAHAADISGERMKETILVGRETCTGCPVRCKRVCSGSFAGEAILEEYGGPEYETLGALGSLCLNSSLEGIALANQKCNQYGLDTISTGVLIAFAMEATERGLLIPGIAWGDAEGIVRLIDEIVAGTGTGGHLAQGLDSLADEIGGRDFAVLIKGVEVPMHDPRGKKSLGISYATSPRGAAHMETVHDPSFEGESPTPEIGVDEGVSRLSWDRKAEYCKKYEDLCSFSNSLVLCAFNSSERISSSNGFFAFSTILELTNALTGLELDYQEMLRIGERNYAIRRLVAGQDGYRMDGDDLPQRLKEPLGNGVCAGEEIQDAMLRNAIKEYYELRGFDEAGPTDARLQQLGLGELAGRLHRQPRTAGDPD